MVRISKSETGKNIRRLLAEYGISVRDVQEELELDSPQSVYKWLNGKALPSLENLMILGSMLNIPMEEILVTDGPEEKEVVARRKRWLKNHPPVFRGCQFTSTYRGQTISLLLSDIKTDWKPERDPEQEDEGDGPATDSKPIDL